MTTESEARFLGELAKGIMEAGGVRHYEEQAARQFAQAALDDMRRIGRWAYPNLFEISELRFVYQWDEDPMVVVIMVWDDHMWRNIAKVQVPPGIVE